MELIGQTIGGFRIVEEIGRGGMAVVYKAWQDTLERYVALKVLPSYYRHDTEFVARFQQEAHAAARLNHPNIVKIYDAAEKDGFSYIAMEYIEGQSLDRLLAERQRPLDLPTATSVVSQIASALDYAHLAEIVHRDVKPNNILLDAEGRAVLTDFGIARASEARRLTMTGMLVGTPEYMSPEQVEGQSVDARSDIYSLGLVAYYLLAGQAPFTASQPQAILYAQVHRPPPSLLQFNRALPASVERVVFHALAKDPKNRYQAAGEFAKALQQASAGERIALPPRKTAKKPPWIWAGGGVAALAVIALLVFGLPDGDPTPTPVPTATSISNVTPSPSRASTHTVVATDTPSARTRTPTPKSGSPGPTLTLSADATPQVTILAPSTGSRHEVGDTLDISYRAQDDEGLDHVQLWVDGDLYAEVSLQGSNSTDGNLAWQPSTPGRYELEIVVVDENGQPSPPSRVRVTVSERDVATSTPFITPTRTSSPTPTLSPSPTPVPPEVACDFGTTRCRWDWVFSSENASYSFTGSKLDFEVSRANTVRQILLEDDTFRDFTVVVRVQQYSGHASGVYGLVFRHRNHENSYWFSINGTGQFEIGGEVAGEWQYLPGYRGEQSSSAINRTGNWNTLKITCSGTRIRAYVNGTLVADARHSAFSSGYVGLMAGTTRAGRNLGVYFDDFEVYVP